MTARLLTNIGRLWTGTEILGNAAIVTSDDRIAWVGPASELPRRVPGVIDDIVDVDLVENLGGGLVTPGLIDAHTRPVYAGNRYAELAMRSSGLTDAEITAAGGGINATLTVTRGTDPWTLCNHVRERLAAWLRSGTTTIEAKTGYHLTRDGELAAIRTLRSLEAEPGMPRVHATFMAAHVVPPEFFGRRSDYVEAVASWCPDAAAIGADGIDVDCGDGRFTEDEARWILGAGRRSGLLTRVHAGESNPGKAVGVAADVGCASVDLLNVATDDDVTMLSRAGVCAVVCPATAMRLQARPPVRAILNAGASVALGSGHTPGAVGITSMPLVISLAIGYLGMSVTEALRAVTVGAAHALRAPDRGAMARGRLADIVLWEADHEGAFAWDYGLRPRRVWHGGEPVTA
ncbi:MAG: amidohydrolase family protein [Nocardiopsaceae bacterium]|nr:amidohydrolase family protein [Nocardiopsaceae bacterium]